MTNEEMQQAMRFMIEQQGQSSAKIDALAEVQKRAEERWTRTEESIRALLTIAEIHEREITNQGKQILTLGESTRALGETARATDERLNVLINVVERNITEGRDGKK